MRSRTRTCTPTKRQGRPPLAQRTPTGNTLALIGVTTLVFVIVIALVLLYMSMVRSDTEHKTAIEAAAIAAAKDVSRIAVDTDEWGWVSLTEQPPIATQTRAPDQYFTEVHSINELMATARNNAIIAAALGDPFMQALSNQDVNNVKTANTTLVTVINGALSGGSAQDAFGNTVNPLADAQQAYLKDQAKGSTYVAGSLQLTLGGIQGGIPTGIQIPNPPSKAACTGLEAEGFYMSDTDIPFNGTSYVFGSVGKRVALCNINKFSTNVTGIPYQMPAVVRAVATQQFSDQGKTWQTTFTACACAGALDIPRPNPGALTVSFPDGPMPEITKISDTWTYGQLNTSCPMDLYTSVGGDFIVSGSLGPYPGQASIPWTLGNPPQASEVCKLAVYDWLRCGGSHVNVDDAVQMITKQGFAPPSKTTTSWISTSIADPTQVVTVGSVPQGVMHIFTIQKDGSINYKTADIKPAPYTVIGEGQIYAELQDMGDITSSVAKWRADNIQLPVIKGMPTSGSVEGQQMYDLYVRDLCRHLGKQKGGRHAGERMDGNPQIGHNYTLYGWQAEIDNGEEYDYGAGSIAGGEAPPNGPSGNNNGNGNGTHGSSAGGGVPPMITRQDDFASSNLPKPSFYTYSQGPGSNGQRPCYTKTGLAADIRFRRLLNVGDLDFLIGGNDFGYIGEMR